MPLVGTITPAVQEHSLSDLYVPFMLQNKLRIFSPDFPDLKYQELSNVNVADALETAGFTFW